MRNSFLSFLAIVAITFTGNFVCLAQISANAPQAKANKKIEKLKSKVADIGTGGKITAVMIGGQKHFGKVSQIGTEDFQMIDVDSGQAKTLNYADLKKVHHGDGDRNYPTGKRANPRRGWLYGLAIAGALAVILAIGLGDKDF